LVIVSSASNASPIAPGSLATIYGANLASGTAVGTQTSQGGYPLQLAGATVAVDGASAQLLYASPGQINFVVPESTRTGSLTITVDDGKGGLKQSGSADVSLTAPAIFVLDANRTGAAINAVTYALGPFEVTTPSNPGSDKATRLAIYATGLRYAGNSSRTPGLNVASAVNVTAYDSSDTATPLKVEYAGAALGYAGLDQLNVVLPGEFQSGGLYRLQVSADSRTSNQATISVLATLVSGGLSSLTVNPASVLSGGVATGTVTLSAAAPGGGTVVSLQVSDASLGSVPPTVTIAAGQNTANFTFVAKVVSTTQTVAITAKTGDSSRTTSVTVAAPPKQCANIAGTWSVTETGKLTCTLTKGGVSETGTESLRGSGSVLISQVGCEVSYTPPNLTASVGQLNALRAGTIDGSNVKFSGLLAVSASAAYETNTLSATGSLSNGVINMTSSGTVTGSGYIDGEVVRFSCTQASTGTMRATTFTTNLDSITLSPASVSSGAVAVGTLTLSHAAGSSIMYTGIESSDTAVASVDASVPVQPGQRTGTFRILANAVTSPQTVLISAVYGLERRTVTLTVNPRSSGDAAPSGAGFVSIPAGEFMMGCSTSDTKCQKWEYPVHGVRITKQFELGQFEVTQAEWDAVMGTNPSDPVSTLMRPNLPVGYISWDDAQHFLARLNARLDGYRYRLPTEAEWEYAARAGTVGPWYDNLDNIAWYMRNAGFGYYPVGQKLPNAWGLYDMIGNASELVQDFWSDSYPASTQTDPQGPSTGSAHVLRGGSVRVNEYKARASYREFASSSSESGPSDGFRYVREPVSVSNSLVSLAVSPSSVQSGSNVTVTVTVARDAPAWGTAIALASSDEFVAVAPPSVTIAPGQTSVTFIVKSKAVPTPQAAVITASLGAETRTASIFVNPKAGTRSGNALVGMDFVSIPTGSFEMGCSVGDTTCTSNEKPRHTVRITKQLEMSRYEVTEAQWYAVMGTYAYLAYTDLPYVTGWPQAQMFFEKLNARADGYRYRMPTEAEWEYAARAGTTGAYYGNPASIAWYGANSASVSHPVGMKQPNSWGLYDMLGNVAEWVQDWYGNYSPALAVDPTGPPVKVSESQVERGGSFSSGSLRVSSRTWGLGASGIRCVRERIAP
jgi:uncharacterized protein (TIGR03437 family)